LKTILPAVSALAGIGLALSLVVHTAALAGATPFGTSAFALHAGVFVVWLPTVMVIQRYTRDFPRRDFWKIALRGCPPWMKRLTYGFFAYAFAGFAYYVLTSALHPVRHSGPPDAATVRGFSGLWMAFYSTAMALLYSSSRMPALETRLCVQGHRVGPLARFCEQCGGPVIERPSMGPAAP